MWIELHDTARDHPKTGKLAKDLGVTPVVALGHLCSLWTWTLRMAPDGDLSSFDAEDIELGAQWDGDAGAFVAAAVGRRLLDETDHGFTIHDWMDFAGSMKAARRARDYRKKKRDEKARSDATNAESRDGMELQHDGAVTVCDNSLTDQTRPDRPDRPDRNDHIRASISDNVIRTTKEFEDKVSSWGWLHVGARVKPVLISKAHRLLEAGPFTASEISHAHAASESVDDPFRRMAYFLGVVEHERQDAARERSKPVGPGPAKRRTAEDSNKELMERLHGKKRETVVR